MAVFVSYRTRALAWSGLLAFLLQGCEEGSRKGDKQGVEEVTLDMDLPQTAAEPSPPKASGEDPEGPSGSYAELLFGVLKSGVEEAPEQLLRDADGYPKEWTVRAEDGSVKKRVLFKHSGRLLREVRVENPEARLSASSLFLYDSNDQLRTIKTTDRMGKISVVKVEGKNPDGSVFGQRVSADGVVEAWEGFPF